MISAYREEKSRDYTRICIAEALPRRLRNGQIAVEEPLASPQPACDAATSPMEVQLERLPRRPLAVAGFFENGFLRPLETAIKLLERAARDHCGEPGGT